MGEIGLHHCSVVELKAIFYYLLKPKYILKIDKINMLVH